MRQGNRLSSFSGAAFAARLRSRRLARLILWLVLPWAWPPAAVAQPAPALAVLPLYDGGTRSFLYFDLGNGRGFLDDRLRDPLQIRSRALEQNLYSEIGRPVDQPAIAGEILLAPILASDGSTRAALFVETSTGYVAFFDEVGRGGRLGEILVALARPFDALATRDGNYALLMRRDDSGRTEGAYLYHATSGRASYYGGLRQLDVEGRVAAVQGLPQLAGKVAAAEIQSAREDTRGYWILDAGGGIHVVELDPGNVARMTAHKSALELAEVFPSPGGQATAQRFVAVPVLAADDRTQHVFVLDASSGDMALVENVDALPALSKLTGNLYDTLGAQPSGDLRVWAAVPNLSGSGQTIGIWLLDSLTRATVYVDNPGSPGQTVIRRVAIGG